MLTASQRDHDLYTFVYRYLTRLSQTQR